MFNTMTARLLSVTVVVAAFALWASGMLLSDFFRDYVIRDVDTRLEDMIDQMIGASEIGTDGMLRFNRPLFDQRFAQPYSGWYWLVAEQDQPPFRSRSLWDFEIDLDLKVANFNLMFHEHSGPDGQMLRVAERDVILPEANRIFRFVAATDMNEVAMTIKRFDDLVFQSLGLIAIAILGALVLQLSIALAPLRTIRRHLVEVRNGSRAQMGTDYPQDMQMLANEITALIQHNKKLVERARTHVGNLAHALKTPLSVVQNEMTDLGGDRSKRVRRQIDDMVSHIDHHLRRARVAGSGGPGVGVNVHERLVKTTRAIEMIYRDKMLDVGLSCDDGILFDGEQQDLDEIIGNLTDNAAKWAAKQIRVSIQPVTQAAERPYFIFQVEDDGPGVDKEQRDVLFERGRRLDETKPGTGLGLSIVADIVDLYGGSSNLSRSDLGGLLVSVQLPMKAA